MPLSPFLFQPERSLGLGTLLFMEPFVFLFMKCVD